MEYSFTREQKFGPYSSPKMAGIRAIRRILPPIWPERTPSVLGSRVRADWEIIPAPVAVPVVSGARLNQCRFPSTNLSLGPSRCYPGSPSTEGGALRGCGNKRGGVLSSFPSCSSLGVGLVLAQLGPAAFRTKALGFWWPYVSRGISGRALAMGFAFRDGTTPNQRRRRFLIIAGLLPPGGQSSKSSRPWRSITNSRENTPSHSAVVMTFFFSTIYFQYHIKIVRSTPWKKTSSELKTNVKRPMHRRAPAAFA